MATRLYRHALESIFAHLTLPELAHISATCRDWSAAVNSMRPIGSCVGRGRRRVDLHSIRSSRLMRHVSTILFDQTLASVFDLPNLCDIIKQSKSLVEVDLRGNLIGGEGASVIAEAIKQTKSPLYTVNLRDNSLGDVGVVTIAEAIKRSKSLSTVGFVLQCNQWCRCSRHFRGH